MRGDSTDDISLRRGVFDSGTSDILLDIVQRRKPVNYRDPASLVVAPDNGLMPMQFVSSGNRGLIYESRFLNDWALYLDCFPFKALFDTCTREPGKLVASLEKISVLYYLMHAVS